MQQEIYASIGAAIRRRRAKIGMTQAALADMAGLSRTSVTNIERGGQALLVHQLLELARALRVNPTSLLPTAQAIEDRDERPMVTEEIKALLDRLEGGETRKRPR